MLPLQLWDGVFLGKLVWLLGRKQEENRLCFRSGNGQWLNLFVCLGQVLRPVYA